MHVDWGHRLEGEVGRGSARGESQSPTMCLLSSKPHSTPQGAQDEATRTTLSPQQKNSKLQLKKAATTRSTDSPTSTPKYQTTNTAPRGATQQDILVDVTAAKTGNAILCPAWKKSRQSEGPTSRHVSTSTRLQAQPAHPHPTCRRHPPEYERKTTNVS
ncbi:hypothetical protein D9611_007580 [Ephemerocybe angulata]|uniref:Uncharacterized protein n=1 Tax=Ephemerocybe angulata TaxID=980116 RepID=A0A8H5C0G2_9AGAR|nr:hypothetical protein D9611_007580 [Tulosesus angulatus]